MRICRCLVAVVVALVGTSIATADVTIDFNLDDGTFDAGPLPERYHSGPIILEEPLKILPEETKSIWVVFDEMMHLEVIDEPSNTNGVERLQTHIGGQVLAEENPFTDLWIDITLTGVEGHIREVFPDPDEPHANRPPLGTGDGGDPVPPGPTTGDDPTGDWDGAYDDSGTDLWDLFFDDVVVDTESHVVVGGFLAGTVADDLTDDRYLFHDIHWTITNHGPNEVEIRQVEFWQDGNRIAQGDWIPEPSSLALGMLCLMGWGLSTQRRVR